jgi:hypothetical protein
VALAFGFLIGYGSPMTLTVRGRRLDGAVLVDGALVWSREGPDEARALGRESLDGVLARYHPGYKALGRLVGNPRVLPGAWCRAPIP